MPSSNWPEPMADYAFTGLAGEFVRLVTPESEADPHALLLALLVGFGAMVGRKPHYLVESRLRKISIRLRLMRRRAVSGSIRSILD